MLIVNSYFNTIQEIIINITLTNVQWFCLKACIFNIYIKRTQDSQIESIHDKYAIRTQREIIVYCTAYKFQFSAWCSCSVFMTEAACFIWFDCVQAFIKDTHTDEKGEKMLCGLWWCWICSVLCAKDEILHSVILFYKQTNFCLVNCHRI